MEKTIKREFNQKCDVEFIRKLKDNDKDGGLDDELRIQIAIDVNAVLERMPNKRYSEILRLLLINGYAASDVAEMLDLKVDNVYNLKHRAIKQFIRLYADDRIRPSISLY